MEAISIEKILIFSIIGVIVLGSIFLRFLIEKNKETPIGKAVWLPLYLVILVPILLFEYSQWEKFNEKAQKIAQSLKSIQYESVNSTEKEAFIKASKKVLNLNFFDFIGRSGSNHYRRNRRRQAQQYLNKLEQVTADSKITHDEIKILTTEET